MTAATLALLIFATCDHDCLDLWYRKSFHHLDNLPPEVAAESLLQSVNTRYILDRVAELADSAPEPCPIRALFPLTDSIPGATAQVLRDFPTRFTLKVNRLRKLSAIALKAAVEEFHSLDFPTTAQSDEQCTAANYFQLGFDLARKLDSTDANILYSRLFSRITTMEALADLHEVLYQQMRQGQVSKEITDLYLQILPTIQIRNRPNPLTWPPTIWLWSGLLQSRFSTRKLELLNAAHQLLRSMPAPTTGPERFIMSTRVGRRKSPDFWPTDARRIWTTSLSSIDFSKPEQELLATIEKDLFPESTLPPVLLQRSALWSRPAATEFFEAGSKLRRQYDELSGAGAWEPRLGEFLHTIRNYNPESRTDDEVLTTFLERHYAWRNLLAFSNYSAPKAGTAPTPEQANARPAHSAKQAILRDILANLESEEGRRIYNRRRAYWIGFLRIYTNEIHTNQPELREIWKSLASATASDIIATYAR